jgi:hypothetical protein
MVPEIIIAVCEIKSGHATAFCYKFVPFVTLKKVRHSCLTINVYFIAAPNTAALSEKKPASPETSPDSRGAQASDKRNALYPEAGINGRAIGEDDAAVSCAHFR